MSATLVYLGGILTGLVLAVAVFLLAAYRGGFIRFERVKRMIVVPGDEEAS